MIAPRIHSPSAGTYHHPSVDLKNDNHSKFRNKRDETELKLTPLVRDLKHEHTNKHRVHKSLHKLKSRQKGEQNKKEKHENQHTKDPKASTGKETGSSRQAKKDPVISATNDLESNTVGVVDLVSSDQDSTSKMAQPPYNRASMLAQGSLACLVAIAVGWVFLFSVLSSHTQIAREEIYEEFETKYFDEKAGAWVFSYMVVFYLILGSVTYLALMQHVRLPKPSFAMIRSYHIPYSPDTITPLELALVFLVIATQFATFLARVIQRFDTEYWPSERVWYELSKNFGKMAAFSLMLLIIPVSKTSFWLDLFNFQFERAIKLHRWIAWWLVFVVCAHAVTAIVSLIIAGNFTACMLPNEECHKPGGYETYLGLETSRIVTYGWIAILIALPLVVTSIPWFRRHKFEWFYYTHFLFIPFILMLHLHYPDLIYYMAPGLTAYTLDKVIWYCATRRRTRMVNLSIPAPGFVRVTVAIDKEYIYLPGQWVLINIPAISFLQWHPMSVSSCPGHSTITIDIKVLGDWSKKLAKFAAHFDPSSVAHTTIFVDGFYGSSHTEMQGYLNHPVVAMFGGGIGVTPMMASLRHLVEQSSSKYPHIQKVVFVWCVKKMSCLELYRQELAGYQRLRRLASGCQLEIIVHATLSEKETDPSSTTEDDIMTAQRSDFCPSCTQSYYSYQAGPFKKYVVSLDDYKWKLGLTILAGCSSLLGIFLANVAAYANNDDWKDEAVGAFRLILSVGLTALTVAATLAISSFSRRRGATTESWTLDKEKEDQEGSANIDDHDLDVVIGKRPDPFQILAELKQYCQDNDIRSVGVCACGPPLLVDTVLKASRDCSSPAVEFVLDDETFDW